jgi:hypothetical protein
MKWAMAATLAVVLAFGTAQAAEEKVLYCIETASQGLYWENGTAKPTKFTPDRHVVKVHANGDRTIGNSLYECSQLSGGAIFCNKGWPTVPWMFKGNNFTSAFMFGENVGGDPNIWVTYGTCTDF